MKNNFDAAGVLVLSQVTPVITALFADFNLDGTRADDGRAPISQLSGAPPSCWQGIHRRLLSLAAGLDLPSPNDDAEDANLPWLLRTLAHHFSPAPSAALLNLIDEICDDDPVSLEALFHFATHMDDGHGLVAIEFEGAWHCAIPGKRDFGGAGSFISREVGHLTSSSSEALLLGSALRAAILANDLDSAAKLLCMEVLAPLGSIPDGSLRSLLRQRVFGHLLADLLSHVAR